MIIIIFFSDEIELGNPLGYIQYQDNNGSWVNADILRVLPIQRDGRLLIKSLPERVDYTIGMACLNSPEDKLSFPCSIQYTYLSESKFKYILTAPYMEIYLYFQDDKHPNESDEFSVEFELQNCTILYQEQEITGPLRLFAHNKSDSGFQGDIWSNMGFFIASPNGNSCITDTFSGSASVEDMPYPDRFFCTYANEIDVDLEGSLSFRYGSHSSDYQLFSDRVYLHADDSYLEENKKNQLEVLSEYMNLDENGAWFSVDPFAANLEIEASNSDKTRTTSFKYNCTVDGAEINGVSLFSNIKTFFVDNTVEFEFVGIIVAIIAYLFPIPEECSADWLPGRKKGGKRLKK